MHYTNINGKLVPAEDAKALVQHTAAMNGIGLLETILISNGVIQLSTYHWDRLVRGIQTLGLPITSIKTLEGEILRAVDHNNLNELCRVRLQVFGDDQSDSPQYIIECADINPDIIRYNQAGLTIGIAKGIIKNADNLSNLKTTKLALYHDAQKVAKLNGWDDAFLQNDKGHIIESTIANIFWVKEDILYTPPLSEGCIAGVMRRYLLEELPKYSIPIKESILNEETILDADQVFLTNAIRRIKWVRAIGPRTYSNELSSKIYSLLFS